MNKIAFVVPYFGQFNNYFQLFLNSCGKNKEIADWLIFTDDKRVFVYPENVKVHYTTFDAIKARIQNKFDFQILLTRPYKLCDLKPMYGYLFAEELTEYQWWGHCDIDLIWGRIADFITDELLSSYYKLFCLGHCSLYRNIDEINLLFLRSLHGQKRAKAVLQCETNCSFDEEYNDSINCIFEAEHVPMYCSELEANIYTKSSLFRLTTMNERHCYDVEKKIHSFFVWDDGILRRYFFSDGTVQEKQYLYIHMQARPMKVHDEVLSLLQYKIIPNAFEPLEAYPVTESNFFTIRYKYLNFHYFRLRTRNLLQKIKKKLRTI